MFRRIVQRFLPVDRQSRSLVRQLFSSKYRDLRRLEAAVNLACNGRVASGPFAGMRHGDIAVGSVLTVKLLGTYEKELWPIIDQIIATAYPLIIDIGAAEGYYAVGLAMRIPAAAGDRIRSAGVPASDPAENGLPQRRFNARRIARLLHAAAAQPDDRLAGRSNADHLRRRGL